MLTRIFLNDKLILGLIVLNSFVIFLSGFTLSTPVAIGIDVLDNAITLVFLAEIIIKLRHYGKSFFYSNWNIFDFVLVMLSLPAILSMFGGNLNLNLDFLLVFRIFRVFKSIRFLRFVPGVEHLLRGTVKALRSSVFVLLGFSIYIFIIAILSFSLFGNTAPELFENPLKSIYTIFKIFTIEGWYEIPETVVEGMGEIKSFFTIAYFVFVLVTGGLFGLSLVNSIFVDAMLEDNNDDLNKKLSEIKSKLDKLNERLDGK
ncbi:MAG: ion transporter [Luteibaculaceae bacterium]